MSRAQILVVDDNPDLRNLLQGLLGKVNGFRVFAAEDGPTALRLFSEVWPDLVILDVTMPGISGIEVARHIRQTSAVPILFLSAVGTPQIVAEGLNAGAEAFLTKPFSPRALVSKVYELLRW